MANKSLSARFADWYERESKTTNYDVFMRLPALFYFGFIIWLQARLITQLLSTGLAFSDGLTFASLLARSATMLVLLMFAGLTILRRKPVSRAKGVMPRLVAFLAVAILFGFPMLERSEPVMAIELASVVLSLISASLTGYVVLWLGRNFSTMPEARKLVTGGPYRLARHPLYLAEEIALLTLVLQYRTPVVVGLVILQFGLQIARTFYEEKVLSEAFPEYAGYQATTARIIPGVI